MMNVRDLRIGNYLCDPEIGQKHEFIVSAHDLLEMATEHNEYRAIQLTEEWLLKFGFVKEEGHSIFFKKIEIDEHECDGFSIELSGSSAVDVWLKNESDDFDDLYNGVVLIKKNINEVHKLQNLFFALTGEELKVK